jgi:hypothetical protein
MSLKELQSNLVKVAQHLSALPVDPEGASRVVRVAYELKTLPPKVAIDENDPEELGLEYLQDKLEPFKKGHGMWLPPHNFGLNRAIMGWNLWVFTILPLFPKKTAYSAKSNGIVIQPNWVPMKGEHLFREMDLKLAEKLVSIMQRSNTVQETVRRELDWIEKEFQVEVPLSIRSQMEKEALTMARRRWGTNRLRLKNRLIPLDGSKPRDI